MSVALTRPPPVTVAAFERFLDGLRDDSRWELVAGEILGMTNPSVRHAMLADALTAAIRAKLPADGRYRVTAGGLRVQMSEDERGTFAPVPDVLVWCGAPEQTRHFVTTPLIVAEVLSPGNMDHDRGAKLQFYKTALPTLRHIALVYQDQMRIECYDRAADGWTERALTQPDDVPRLDALLLAVPLAELYAGIALPG